MICMCNDVAIFFGFLGLLTGASTVYALMSFDVARPNSTPDPDYASHRCKRAGGFVDTSCTAACDCHKTMPLTSQHTTKGE